MPSLEVQLRKRKRSFASLFGSLLICGLIFTGMGLMHFDIKMPEQEILQPLSEFHLPPPPPPPPSKKESPTENVPISFNIPAEAGPGDVPLGFLQTNFGIKPKQLAQPEINVASSLENFKTDGLETLKIYSQNEVTEKPQRIAQPALDIPRRYLKKNGSKPIEFVVLYTVTEKGRTTNVHVLDCPFPEIIPFIVEYIEGWRLKPAMIDGKPVNSWVQHRFTFRPSSGSPFSI